MLVHMDEDTTTSPKYRARNIWVCSCGVLVVQPLKPTECPTDIDQTFDPHRVPHDSRTGQPVVFTLRTGYMAVPDAAQRSS